MYRQGFGPPLARVLASVVLSLVTVVFTVVFTVTSVCAHDQRPSLILHVAASQGAGCANTPADLNDVSTAAGAAGGHYAAYVVVNVPDPSYAGMDHFSFGTWYEQQGIQVTGWHFCATQEYPGPTWPAPGSEITLSWQGGCEQRSTFVAGWFDVYADNPGTLALTGGNDRTVWMAGCGLRSYSLDSTDVGWASFGGAASDGNSQGCNPFVAPCYYRSLPAPSNDIAPMDNAILLHVAPASGTTCFNGPTSKDQIVTKADASASGIQYHVYVLGVPQVTNPNGNWGIAGMQFGIDYDKGKPGSEKLVVDDWHACSDLEFTGDNWPQTGSGDMVTWVSQENCQRAPLVPAGYFTVTAYAPSSMALIPHPVAGEIKMANCNAVEVAVESPVNLTRVGWVSMGGGIRGTSADGCNPLLEPCTATTPVRPTTWGKVKALYPH
jgi:hypothetical protein